MQLGWGYFQISPVRGKYTLCTHLLLNVSLFLVSKISYLFFLFILKNKKLHILKKISKFKKKLFVTNMIFRSLLSYMVEADFVFGPSFSQIF